MHELLSLNIKIASVLDLKGGDSNDNKENEVPIEKLREAKVSCHKLLEVVSARGVVVEEFDDPWRGAISIFKDVDDRWAECDDKDEEQL
ncbi:hypothetical protein B0T17DRAFT_615270 [Bombardia bombarda]|uniref:Uncharacterized protein n=1 Tax=Bombardia bombarda TaxID=252184 RepID=A0AA39X8X8_9PEZI|nr:hypothetical protein B0T17DRAFT_615270 [Bombardia bombarda]